MQISFKRFLLWILILLSAEAFAQKRLLLQLDSSLVNQNPYLMESGLGSALAKASETIDPENTDLQLAAALVFHELNKWRSSKRLQPYREHSKLDRIAYHYSIYYNRFRFRGSQDNYFRLKRTLKKVPKYMILDFTYLDGYVDLPYTVDYKKGAFYYNDELGTSSLNLYTGKYSREEDFVEEPIERLSYQAFAEEVVQHLTKSKSGSLLRSKAYELLAVRIAPVKKRKAKRKIPQLKVIYLIGAYRNKHINDWNED